MKYDKELFNLIKEHIKEYNSNEYTIIHNQINETMYIYCWKTKKRKGIRFFLKQITNKKIENYLKTKRGK